MAIIRMIVNNLKTSLAVKVARLYCSPNFEATPLFYLQNVLKSPLTATRRRILLKLRASPGVPTPFLRSKRSFILPRPSLRQRRALIPVHRSYSLRTACERNERVTKAGRCDNYHLRITFDFDPLCILNNKALVNMYVCVCVCINTRDFNIRYRYLFRGARSLAGFR